MRPHQRPPTRPRRRVEKKRKASRPVSRVPPPPPAPPASSGPPNRAWLHRPSASGVTRRICSWAAYGTRRSVAAASPARSRATGHTRLSRGISPGLPTRADTVQGGGVGAAAPARLRFAAHATGYSSAVAAWRRACRLPGEGTVREDGRASYARGRTRAPALGVGELTEARTGPRLA